MSMLYTAALDADPHLDMDTIFTLSPKPHQAQLHTQTLDTPTIHHLDTAMVASSQHHSWQEVITFNQTRWKSSMKQTTNKQLQLLLQDRD